MAHKGLILEWIVAPSSEEYRSDSEGELEAGGVDDIS